MKLLLIDTEGLGLSLAWRAVMAGHQVRWFLDPKPDMPMNSGDGFKDIVKVKNWVEHMKWADLVLQTGNDKYLEKLDFFRKKGFPVFGPTPESAKLEISRKAGMEMFKKVGIEVVPYQTFKSMKEAAQHVEKTKERFVFKTLGDNEDKSLTYVSKNASDMLEWIERMIEQKKEPKGEVMLQTFVKGIEMGISRFMGTKGFIGQWNESFEHKKVMSGGYGPNCGEMGTIAYFTKESKLAKETLAKMEEELVKLRHTGDIAIGFMIPEDAVPRPTEFTVRFGWPIENMMLGATQGDPVSWMKDALEGKDTTTFKEEIGCCLVMGNDFPNSKKTNDELANLPIYGITKGNKKHLHPQDTKIDIRWDMDGENMVKRPVWNTTGHYAAIVTGFGKDVKQATTRAYGTVKKLHLSNMVVRDDVGEELEETLPELHKMGYAEHCEYEKT